MIVKEFSSSTMPRQIIQSVLGGLKLEGTELIMVQIEAKEETTIIEVATEVPEDRGF